MIEKEGKGKEREKKKEKRKKITFDNFKFFRFFNQIIFHIFFLHDSNFWSLKTECFTN